jgi:hypothetical protein
MSCAQCTHTTNFENHTGCTSTGQFGSLPHQVFVVILDLKGNPILHDRPYPVLRRTASGHLYQVETPCESQTPSPIKPASTDTLSALHPSLTLPPPTIGLTRSTPNTSSSLSKCAVLRSSSAKSAHVVDLSSGPDSSASTETLHRKSMAAAVLGVGEQTLNLSAPVNHSHLACTRERPKEYPVNPVPGSRGTFYADQCCRRVEKRHDLRGEFLRSDTSAKGEATKELSAQAPSRSNDAGPVRENYAYNPQNDRASSSSSGVGRDSHPSTEPNIGSRSPGNLAKEGKGLRPGPGPLPLALTPHHDAADRTASSIVERRKKMVELSTRVAQSSISVGDKTGEKKRGGKRSVSEDIWTLTACD